MARIEKPANDFAAISDVSGLLTAINQWTSAHKIAKRGFHNRAWFRGHSKRIYELEPGVYRGSFTKEAATMYGKGLEMKRLNLEREMLSEFRTVGAPLLKPDEVVPLYFTAQHFGMPTRLLDWTANPLAALFFAVMENDAEDGDLFIMEPTQVIPKPIEGAPKQVLQNVKTMRHPIVTDAIGVSFWHEPKELLRELILPIRPDNQLGRIGQQSSLFTLHVHGSTSKQNPTLSRIKILAKAKVSIREELRRLNINQFSIFNDLDHLSKEIRMNWSVS